MGVGLTCCVCRRVYAAGYNQLQDPAADTLHSPLASDLAAPS